MRVINDHFSAFCAGQESGLCHYMKTFGHSLRYFAFSLVRSKELAEEIVSDSFYKLWKGRDKIKSELSIKAFLYIATRNACYDVMGTVKHQVMEDTELLNSIHSADPDVLTRIIHAELVEMVVKEIDSLPPQQRNVFRMTFLQQMNAEEIAKTLAISLSNVYFARSVAMNKIRSYFEMNKSFQKG